MIEVPHYLQTYLPVVTADYFGRLQSTHAATVRDMPDALRAEVQPWFSNPDAGLRAPLFTTAMNGSLANFLGDAARGELAPTPVRAETAVNGALTMGLLGIMRDTVARAHPDRTPQAVQEYHVQVRHALLNETARPAPSANLWHRGQMASFGLARYLQKRLGLAENTDRLGRTGLHFGAYTQAVEGQFTTDPRDVEELTFVAGEIGVATTGLMLNLTEMVSDKQYADGRSVADSLGKQGSFRDHGTLLLTALRSGVPTYATAMLARKKFTSSTGLDEVAAAIKEVYAEREKLVTRAHVGVDADYRLNRFQHDIHNMAGMLTRRMYAVKRRREIRAAGGKAAYLGQVKDRVIAQAA